MLYHFASIVLALAMGIRWVTTGSNAFAQDQTERRPP